ncbi:MAG: tyrosine-type recombinase/integrase, partial [Nitrososphaerota archaeon]
MQTENSVESFLNSMYIQSHSLNTKNSYKNGLIHFENFVAQQYQSTLLTIVEMINTQKLNPYKILNEFVAYLDSKNLRPKTVKLCISAVKGYLRYVEIKIYSEDFRQLVKLPKARRYREEPLTKEIILRVLRNITTKLQVVILMLVASGMRIGELV